MSEKTSDISQRLVILEEIAALISRSHELQETLDLVCQLVTREMGFDACSIYLLDDSNEILVLRATQGLDPTVVGKVTMGVNEGITGLSVETLTAVAASDAASHPRYKYFPETHEEEFVSLLACPIIEKGRALGVINVQSRQRREFDPDDQRVIASIATQVAVIVQNYRLLHAVAKHRLSLQAPAETPLPLAAGAEERRSGLLLHGIGASPGISMGRAIVLDRGDLAQLFEIKEYAEDPKGEARALDGALIQVREQIKHAELRVAERLSDQEAQIFSTHLMILEDEGFIGKIEEEVAAGRSALFAVRDVVGYYVRLFEAIDDPYISDKIADIEDVGKRLMNALSRRDAPPPRKGQRGILVAHRITPSDTLDLDTSDLAGIASAEGGASSHASILARSFGVPAVVGIESQLRLIRSGDYLIIDGGLGNVHVNPSKEVLREFRRARREYQSARLQIEEGDRRRATTKDGRRVRLLANISVVADVKTALAYNAEGIGLYRTEFLYLTRPTFPTEDEQCKVYAQIVKQMKNQRVVIRTLDAGGDKYMPQLKGPVEGNPYLGWRSIRVSLDLIHIFKTQLRAILRASARGKAAILFPMITNLEELQQARAILDEVKGELRAEGVAFDRKIPVGMMIEVPSAALMADQFVEQVDFISIGSNDLTQYTLAVDRGNQRVAGLFETLHPAVLQLVDRTLRSAHNGGREVTICGEVGADPEALPVLIGLGCTSLSMSPSALPIVRYVVRELSAERCEKIARKVLRFRSPSEVRECVRKEIARLNLPELDRLRGFGPPREEGK